MHVSRLPLAALAVAATVGAVSALTLLPGAAPPASAETLRPYSSCGDLLAHYRDELARTATAWGAQGPPMLAYTDGAVAASAGGTARAAASDSVAGAPLAAEGTGTTGTNVQERGVDEPDLAKLSGDLLVTVAQGRLQVVRTGAQPEQLSSLSLGDQSYGSELLVQGDRALVLLPQNAFYSFGDAARFAPPDRYREQTTLVLVDLTDPREPAVLEELELSGRYVSARLSDGAVRLVTTSRAGYDSSSPVEPYGDREQQQALRRNVAAARAATLPDVLPHQTRRSADGRVLSDGPAVDCGQVRYADDAQGASTLLVTTLDLDEGLTAVDRTAVTTDGDLVYASPDRLYVATSRWGTTAPAQPADDSPAPADQSRDTATVTTDPQVSTELHGFDVSDPRRTRYLGSGSVDGYVLGRWALSAAGGHLRVATTSAPPWGPGEQRSVSRMTVLAERDGDLVETGRVDGLGVGERIYAVRYFGDIATVVTFRQTDPLYVLDLADPSAPALLGELKVPGFSTYLHPVGDDRVLGIGSSAGATGRVTGLQAQLFDLSDLRHPRQAAVLPLAGPESWTPVAYESRAFGYDPTLRQAVLPLAEYDGRGQQNAAVAIRVGGDGTLREVGRLQVQGQWQIDRVLTRDGRVYALTQDGVVAGTSDLERTGSLTFAR